MRQADHNQTLEWESQAAHRAHIEQAKMHGGYLHQLLHKVSGLNNRVVASTPEGTGLYLIGEGHIVHDFDLSALQKRDARVVAMDRDLPEQPVGVVEKQVQCDLTDIPRMRALLRARSSLASLPKTGTIFASHIARYLPGDALPPLLELGAQSLVPGGSLWIVDTPLCAQSRKVGGSPGFIEARELVKARGDMHIVSDELIVPVVPRKLYHKINALRAQSTNLEHQAFFDAVEANDVWFKSVDIARCDETQPRESTGGTTFRVNVWGIRAMHVQKEA